MFEYRIYDYLDDVRPEAGIPLSQQAAVQRQQLEELMGQLADQGWRIINWHPENYHLLLERPSDGPGQGQTQGRPDFQERWYPPQY